MNNYLRKIAMAGMLATTLACSEGQKSEIDSLEARINNSIHNATHTIPTPQDIDPYLAKWIVENNTPKELNEKNYIGVTTNFANNINEGMAANFDHPEEYAIPETVGYGIIPRSPELRKVINTQLQMLEVMIKKGREYSMQDGVINGAEEKWYRGMNYVIAQGNLLLKPSKTNFEIYSDASEELREYLDTEKEMQGLETANNIIMDYYNDPESHARIYENVLKLIYLQDDMTPQSVRDVLEKQYEQIDTNIKNHRH